jgi:transcriptional regulator with XRE-family HTH domain
MNERIKQLRKHLGLNQTEFGARIGVKQTTIAGYERGASTPLDAVVSAICREFNVSERWLREGEGEMFLPQDDADELMALAGRFLGSNPTETQMRFARAVFTMTPQELELITRKARELLGETKKED